MRGRSGAGPLVLRVGRVVAAALLANLLGLGMAWAARTEAVRAQSPTATRSKALKQRAKPEVAPRAPAPTTGTAAEPVLRAGLRAPVEQFAPTLLSVPGEAMLIDPPVVPPQVLPEIPEAAPIPDQQGIASWYGGLQFQGRKTASGERFDRNALTAAHPTLPFGTRVCVRSQLNGRGVVVRINDRGPHTPNRIIDLSEGAAKSIGMHSGLGLKSVELFALDSGETECPAATPSLP